MTAPIHYRRSNAVHPIDTRARGTPSVANARRLTAITALLALAGCNGENKYQAPPPPEVTVAKPVRRAVTSYLEYTGNARAVQTVDLRARVKGFLRALNFVPDKTVKAGELMMVIEEEPFRATHEQAAAKLAEAESVLRKAEQSKAREVARAQLALNEAAAILAKLEEARQRNLARRDAASKEDYDRADANRKKADAQVEADRASLDQSQADYETNILSAKAAVIQAKSDLTNAQINLDYCRIVAPIDGRISRNLVDRGNLVGDGTATLLATIVQDNPIYVYMTVPESDLLRFRQQVRDGKRVDYLSTPVRLDLALSDEKGFPHEGKLDYADPYVDPATGTITVRGIFSNPDHVIVPGLFARVRVALDSKPDALLVPDRALGADQQGRFLLVVGKDDKVEQRQVTIGSLEPDGMRVVEGKIGPEDRVVVNGLQRARPGQPVKPVEQKAEAVGVAWNRN